MNHYPYVVFIRGPRGSYRGIGLCVSENSARIKAAKFTQQTFATSSINLTQDNKHFDSYRFQRCEDCEYLNACSVTDGICVQCWQQREKEMAEVHDEAMRHYNEDIAEGLHYSNLINDHREY